MDVLDPSGTHLLVVVSLGLARALLLRVTVVAALALVLRGSKPNERPVLLDSFAECLRCMPHAASPVRRRNSSAGSGRR